MSRIPIDSCSLLKKQKLLFNTSHNNIIIATLHKRVLEIMSQKVLRNLYDF